MGEKEYYIPSEDGNRNHDFQMNGRLISWRLLVKITSHNVIRKSMGTIKVIITVQCVRAGAKLPLCLALPLSR